MFLTWVPTACCSLLRASSSTVPSQYCAMEFCCSCNILHVVRRGEASPAHIAYKAVRPYEVDFERRPTRRGALLPQPTALCLTSRLSRESKRRKRCRVGRAPPQWHAAPPPAPARQGGCRSSGRGARDRTREGESAEARAVGAWRRAPELARQTRGYADGSRSRQPRRADWAASSFTSAGGTQSIGAWACTTRRVRVSARSGQVRTHSKSAQSVTQLCRIAERARAPHNDAWASPAQRGARRVLAASQL